MQQILDQYPFLPMVGIFIVAYFFMIRPQMKRSKDEKKFAEQLKKGDKVITKSGMHGKIFDLNDKDMSCVIETMAGKIKFSRSAISMEMSKKLNEPVAEKK
ncbi:MULTISPECIES: preprotein translocase subunit YajC [Cellulophaga]|uniref:Sec translocon accessory complex subunit YajC n=2 Tax=Cellulophaga TaxID=104264 RepID=F0RG02_CELLC|nr:MULTISPECIES: preprotein translocase subunit YajC [Cellulophaga]ADY27962.1 preprotein translocase, YajC subunit [Cellulophaga lytica DSM 7489]AIM59042.1 preprotein translocase [Cellulophaga lytica]APU08844.1 preprotein translocase [Cellulophaga lytica]EWH14117.1 preprotein translocase subunit YajC [Cellulophaga geojensis KL-A]MDO6854350.1 preprotein translocase subunit YajC [Cellulophaga lytica]